VETFLQQILEEYGPVLLPLLALCLGLAMFFRAGLRTLKPTGADPDFSWTRLFRLAARRRSRSDDDPDPLMEAEVYLSYGRKEQAVEILEEAIKTHPARRQEFETRIRELRGQPQPVSPVTKL